MINRAVILLVLCGMTMLLCQFSPQPKGGDEAGVQAELPMVAGGFVGESEPPSDKERELLPADTIIVKRAYRTPGRSVENRDLAHASLVIAGHDSRSIHRPEVCLDGQGWTLLNSTIVPVEITPGRTLQVRDLLVEREIRMPDGKPKMLRAHYVYWFIGTDVTTPSNAMRVWLSTWDNIIRNVNHRWAYASVTTWVTDNLEPAESGQRPRDVEASRKLATEIVRVLVPRFQKDFAEAAPPP